MEEEEIINKFGKSFSSFVRLEKIFIKGTINGLNSEQLDNKRDKNGLNNKLGNLKRSEIFGKT